MSMTAAEYAEDEARAWWDAEIAEARDKATTCRTALAFPDVVRVNGQHLTLEGEGAAFVVAHVAALLEKAEYILAHPEAYWPDTWGESDLDLVPFAPGVALEVAHAVIERAWRALMVAARNTRNARDLARIARMVGRVVSLRRRLAFRALRPEAARPERAHLERREPLISLAQAAHGPPARGGLSMSPQLAGGGCL